jgi:hypothetical protein
MCAVEGNKNIKDVLEGDASKMKELVNLTPHPITMIYPDGEVITIPLSDKFNIVRSELEIIPLENEKINNFPTVFTKLSEVEDLPDPHNGTIYIVSQMTCAAMPERKDLFFPFKYKRDTSGKIQGCLSLARC